MEKQEFQGKVVAITGASAGVGRATARAFAMQGASVGLIARNRMAMENAKREIELIGGRALVCVADVAEPDQVEAAAVSIEAALGPIDVWVNNAMVSVFSQVKDMTAQEFRRVTDVTYLGYVYGTLSALKRMLSRDHGIIIQVGSALASRGIPLQAAYAAAKHAVQGFTESLRSELAHDRSGVRVTSVDLPSINTPHFSWAKNRLPGKIRPTPPVFQPEVAAETILLAASSSRRNVHLGVTRAGASIARKFLPGILSRPSAGMAYPARQTSEAVEEEQPDNLFSPVPGDRGAHGDFGDSARKSNAQLWASKNRGPLSALTASLVGAMAVGFFIASRKASGVTSP